MIGGVVQWRWRLHGYKTTGTVYNHPSAEHMELARAYAAQREQWQAKRAAEMRTA